MSMAGPIEPAGPAEPVGSAVDRELHAALLCRSAAAVELAGWALVTAADAAPQVRARTLASAALAAAWHGPIPLARERARTAAALVRARLADTPVAGLSTVDRIERAGIGWPETLGRLALVETVLEQDHAALQHCQAAVDLAYHEDQDGLRCRLLICCAHLLVRRGALAAAARGIDQAVELAHRTPRMRGLALATRAWVTCLQDGPVAALPHADAAQRASGPPDGDFAASQAMRLLARVRLRSGEPAQARALLLAACGGAGLPGAEVAVRAGWLRVLTEVELALGDRAAATASASAATGAAAEAGLPGQQGHAALAAAQVEPDHRRAAGLAAEAADAFATLERPLEEAQAWLVGAAAARRLGAWDTAEWRLARVRDIAAASGARWLRDAALAGQRGTSGLAGRMVEHAGGLTRREQTIADLLVRGMSNAEIAARLHLTVKTVEAHLTRIYRKLGVRSRGAAAAHLARTARPSATS